MILNGTVVEDRYQCRLNPGNLNSFAFRWSNTSLRAIASAKRSTCCGAGHVFWTADCSSEPTVVLGYCDDPLEYWSAVVLGQAFIFSCFSGTFRKLLMSEYVDLANSTRLGRIFFVPSHQVLEERGKYPPSPPLRLHARVRRSPPLSSPRSC